MTPTRAIHDAVSRRVYLAVRGAGTAAGTMSGQVASLFGAGDRPAGQVAGGNLALAALATLNTMAGDRPGPELAPLAIPMAVRAGGRDVDVITRQLAAAFPRATTRLSAARATTAARRPRRGRIGSGTSSILVRRIWARCRCPPGPATTRSA